MKSVGKSVVRSMQVFINQNFFLNAKMGKKRLLIQYSGIQPRIPE